MAQKTKKTPLPPRPALLKRYSESSLLHPSTLPRHVDHEEIVKLLGEIPSRQRLFNNSATEGSEAPNRYNRRFSELDYENIAPIHSVLTESADEVATFRREYSDVQQDLPQCHRSAPHGPPPRHNNTAPSQDTPHRVPRRATTYHGVPKTHSKRFVRIRESRAKEDATDNKENSDNNTTTVHIPGQDEAVFQTKEMEETGGDEKEADKKECDEVKQDQSRAPTAIKSGNGSIRRYRRSHRRKARHLSDLPLHHERPEDEAKQQAADAADGCEAKKRRSQLTSMASDEDVENLDQYAINQMLSHRYDDIAGDRRLSRTLHISRSPTTPTRSLSASIRRSHKPHQENLDLEQPVNVLGASEKDKSDQIDEETSVKKVASELDKMGKNIVEEDDNVQNNSGDANKDNVCGKGDVEREMPLFQGDEDISKATSLVASSKKKINMLTIPLNNHAATGIVWADKNLCNRKEKDHEIDAQDKEKCDNKLEDENVEQITANICENRETEMKASVFADPKINQSVRCGDDKMLTHELTTSNSIHRSSSIGQFSVDILAGGARTCWKIPRRRTVSDSSVFLTKKSHDSQTETKTVTSAGLSTTLSLAFGVPGMAFCHSAQLEKKATTSVEAEYDKFKQKVNFTKSLEANRKKSKREETCHQPKHTVTFSGNDEEEPNGVLSNSEKVSRQRKKGVTWDGNIDNSEMNQMMCEIGNSQPPVYSWFKTGLPSKPLFVQLNELDRDDMGGQQSVMLNKGACWKSRARWIKFEENWEEGANRWSKPHVASLTFNSLPQLRKGLENGLIMLDVMETSLPNIFNLLVDGLVRMELIEPEHQGAILRMLHLNGTGKKKVKEQQRRGIHGSVSAVRRFSGITDISRHNNNSDNNILPHSPGSKSLPAYATEINCSNNPIFSADEVHVSILENHANVSHSNSNSTSSQPAVPREGILRKLPEDAEGAMVMFAMEDSLNGPVAALLRIVNPPVFDHFLEAPVPLRFIFFLVGPDYSNVDYQEVGRAMSTLFSDDIFRDMAYAAVDKQDLLNGINEFLNDTMVLPPGDWDRDLLLPITRHQKREQEKVMQRRKTISPLQMEKDAEAILKMSQDALNYADPLQRTGRIFGGLVNDVKRRFPHMKSDFTDAINFQCVASFVFIYFACLSPAITFGGLLGEKTDNWMGVSEMIVSTSLCGMLFALFAGQPLVMLGGTGPVLIFEEYLYKFCKDSGVDFMALRLWIGFWIFILATIVVAFEGSVLVRYFTRFTEEIFSTLISIIFIYETYKGLKHIVCTNPLLPDYCVGYDEVRVTVIDILNGSTWTSSTTESSLYGESNSPHTDGALASDTMHSDPYHCNVTQEYYTPEKEDDYSCSPDKNPQPNTALFAIILTFGTFLIAFFLRIFRSSQFLGRTARRALGSFGIAIAILAMVTLAYLVGPIYTHTIKITQGFYPTDPCKRGWLINPMGQKNRLPLGTVFAAIVPAFLVFILLYMETLIIGMVVNKECNKLRKGSGYHLDLFLIGLLSAIAGLMGVPWMCAAPIRTVSHVGSLSVLTRTLAPGVKPKLDHIKDQRVTNFGVSLLIGLSNFMAPLLREVPIAVLLGVFLYLGVTSLSGLQFIERLKIFFMPRKHHPDVRYIRMVKVWKMHMFTIIQVICVCVLWAIKNSTIAMAFPFFLILLIFIRKLLKFIFSDQELEALDSEEEDEDDGHHGYDFDAMQ